MMRNEFLRQRALLRAKALWRTHEDVSQARAMLMGG